MGNDFTGETTCPAIYSWTFSGLVGAFLDLAIAYLLLCASTLAYFASKFLGFFGLCLPCPCNGLFGNPDNIYCLQRVLLDCPSEKISKVQLSVKTKFPSDSIFTKDPHCHSDSKSESKYFSNGHVELEGGASCSSVSGRRVGDSDGGDSVRRNEMDSLVEKEGRRFDVKGKGVMSQRQRSSLRRRKRRGAVDNGKFWSVSSYDPLPAVAQDGPQSPSSVSKMRNEITGGGLVPVNFGDCGEAPVGISLQETASHGFELNDPVDQNKPMEKDTSPVEELRCNVGEELGFDGTEINMIRVLEQALEEEHAARSALYLELEEERSAAASAADEAMAMILRLQEEKASIEMEARQYLRMIEEKSAYDAEEMNILKEILVRRERETHFLRKEVEAYRQMVFANDQLDADVHDMAATEGYRDSSSFYPSEDPVLMLQQITKSIGEKERKKSENTSSDYKVTLIESQNRILSFAKELPIPELDEDAGSSKQVDIHRHPCMIKHHPQLSSNSDEINQKFQEKGIVSMEENPFAQQREMMGPDASSQLYQLSTPQGLNLHEKTITPGGEEQEQNDNACLCHVLVSKTSETCDEAEIIIPYDGDSTEHKKYADQESKDSHALSFDTEPRVHDVHVVGDEFNMCNEVSVNKSKQLLIDATLNIPRKCDSPTMSRQETELDVNRSSTDIISRLPPLGPSRSKAVPSDLRRNSMSAIDYERLKIDNEVGWLRERLRIVQEGRDKLNFSVGHREREKIQLQLLEDIASQLREIRQLTEPGKAVRQASLPLPSSKVMSKKRRWRSISLGIHRST